MNDESVFSLLQRIEEKLDRLLQDNSDVPEEQYEQYMNKVAHLIASGNSAEGFLQSVYDWCKEHHRITRKQIRAIDRIADRPPADAYDGLDDSMW